MSVLTQAHHENDFDTVGRRMSKWMEAVLGTRYQKFCPAETWTPAINLYEDTAQYFVIVDLAGVKGSTIDIRVDDKGTMILSGGREMPEAPSARGPLKLHLMEIDHGRFSRTIELPDDADIDTIQATYRTGMLWIRVPKKA